MVYIRRVKTSSGAIAVQVCEKTRGVRRIVAHIGSAHSDGDLLLLEAAARDRIDELAGQIAFDFLSVGGASNGGLGPVVESTCSRLVWDTFSGLYDQIGFGMVGDEAFRQLVVARLCEPTSKREVGRVIGEMGEIPFDERTYRRCLRRVDESDYAGTLSRVAFDWVTRKKRLLVALFDCTTLHFTSEGDDEEDLKRLGRPKEGGYKRIVQVGLLVDPGGFPIEFIVFPGDMGETRSLIPALTGLSQRHGVPVEGLTVVADAGMLSAANLHALEHHGFNFIVGSKTASARLDLLECLTPKDWEKGFTDGQVFETNRLMKAKNVPTLKRRVVYQYKQARARRDLKTIEDQHKRAEEIVAGTRVAKGVRYVKTNGKETIVDQELYDRHVGLAGLKGYVTNLPKAHMPSLNVIGAYQDLWQVERSFRMFKSDLRARPVYHRLDYAIKAHLTIVFAALGIARELEARTGTTLKAFLKDIRPLRHATVNIEGTSIQIPPHIPPKTNKILQQAQGTSTS